MARKFRVEGVFDADKIVDEQLCKVFDKEEGTEKHRLHRCSSWKEVRHEVLDELRKWEQKANTTSSRKWKCQRDVQEAT